MNGRGWAVAVLLAMVLVFCAYFGLRRPAPGSTPAGVTGSPGYAVAPTSTPAVGTNAADLYRQAMGLVAALRADPGERDLFDRYAQGSLDPQAGEFLKRNARIAELVRQGAATEKVDWGEMDTQSRLTELNRVRDLLRFMLIESKFAMQRQNSALALDDALAAIAMSHHLSHGGVLTSKLVEVGCDMQAIDWIAQCLPVLSPEQLAALPNRLDSLPKAETGSEMMAAEFANAQAMQGDNPAMLSTVQAMEHFYKNVGDAMDTQPPDEVAKTIDAETGKFTFSPTAGMLLKILAPSLKRAHVTMVVGIEKHSLLRTAIDVQSHGEAAVEKSIDPFGQGPFNYTKTAKGFELSSQFQDGNKPVTLVVEK